MLWQDLQWLVCPEAMYLWPLMPWPIEFCLLVMLDCGVTVVIMSNGYHMSSNAGISQASGSGSRRGRAFISSPRRRRPQCRSISHSLWNSSCHWMRERERERERVKSFPSLTEYLTRICEISGWTSQYPLLLPSLTQASLSTSWSSHLVLLWCLWLCVLVTHGERLRWRMASLTSELTST